MDEILASGARLNRTLKDFLKLDLQTSLTFSGLALQSTDDPAKRQRNRQHARHGYDTITHLLDRVALDRSDARAITRDLRRLKSELRQLGETF